jgi:STE24 endopeptidase
MVQFNVLLLAFLAIFLLRMATQAILHRFNLSYLSHEGSTVPRAFQDVIDQERFRKITAYTVESNRFDLLADLCYQGISLVILLSGFLPWLARVIGRWDVGVILEGLAFFGVLSAFGGLVRVPFGLYDTFVIEQRYGFNTMTLRMWIFDLLKSTTISTLLGGLILSVLLTLVVHGGTYWWVWTWILFGFFQILLIWLFPVVIAPWFNKFEPLENPSLKEQIQALMTKAGLRLREVFRMDASRRSKHTNAYFTGLGKMKRIVLFDTLLGSHTDMEILAVLAHEIGHWKKRHLLKQLLLVEVLSLAGLYVVSRLLDWSLLYQTFGFQSPTPFVGLFLIGALISPFSYFAHPVESAISRKFEEEADDFSLELMETAEPLQQALKRLATDNLANLVPHPLYAWFYYSHPPLVERLSRLAKGTIAKNNEGRLGLDEKYHGRYTE